MKTYYDGEEREITGIRYWSFHNGQTFYCVYYTRGSEFKGALVLAATDELDAMRKFPDELARQSINHEE